MGLDAEIKSCLDCGMESFPSINSLKRELASLGYEIDPDLRAACTAKNLTTGNTYPCVTWGLREIDTKRNAFHVESRRDEKFKALQELRRWTFLIQRGRMVSV